MQSLLFTAFAALLCLVPGTVRAAALTGQCGALDARSLQLVAGTVFNETLPPYGDVCFAAHKIVSPINDVTLPGFHPPPYLAVSLYRNGKDVFDFTYPNTPPELWPEAVDGIRAVAFPDLQGDGYKDVIILGHSFDAHGNDVPMPLVFLGSQAGFKLLEALSENLLFNDDESIAEIKDDIKTQFGLYPPLPQGD